jgi:GST-like protein
MSSGYVVFGAAGSGSVIVEAALTLLGEPYRLADRGGWRETAADPEMARINPMRQVPALVLPPDRPLGGRAAPLASQAAPNGGGLGEVMTESAAILIWLADSHPGSGLAPDLASPMRPRFLRWMAFISAQVYALFWIRDEPARLAADEAGGALIKARTAQRIADCWAVMGEQVEPAGRFLLGDDISVLDLYLAVISRWGPRRKAFYAAAPNLAAVVRAVDADPRLAALWADRFPFAEGWEG